MQVFEERGNWSYQRKTSQSRALFLKSPENFSGRKSYHWSTTCLFCKAVLFISCKGNKNKNNWKVSCLKTPSFWRYRENYVTQNTPEKFWDFWETGPREENQQSLPTCDAEPGNQTRAALVGGKSSHHYATTALQNTSTALKNIFLWVFTSIINAQRVI